MARFTPRTTLKQRETDALCMVGHKRERVLGRVGRAVNAAARDFARELFVFVLAVAHPRESASSYLSGDGD